MGLSFNIFLMRKVFQLIEKKKSCERGEFTVYTTKYYQGILKKEESCITFEINETNEVLRSLHIVCG